MRSRCLLVLVVFLSLAVAPRARAAEAEGPLNDAELARLLDQWLPATASLRTREQYLIGKLDDDDPKVREQATRELIDLGDTGSGLVERAANAEEPEVRIRADRIVRAWAGRPPFDRRAHVRREFTVRLEKVTEARQLAMVADRAIRTLESGAPRGLTALALQEALGLIARTKDEALIGRFVPLLKHEEVEVAVFVTRALGEARGGSEYYPPFLLHALASGRAEVVSVAIRGGPSPITDRERLPKLREALRAVFRGENQSLKFDATYHLMQTFRDPEVYPYLLEQAKGSDFQRRSTALGYLGDPCNLGRPAWPALVEVVTPLAASKDINDRRAAVRILRCYTGKETVGLLIPLLTDPQTIVASDAYDGLLERTDAATVREALDHEITFGTDPELRGVATEVRGKLRLDAKR